MLLELSVRDLGVIADLTLVLSDGMTAITGETGAGKTLVVDAIELLVGGRADPVLVRPGADEARVEGRFVVGDDEVVLARTIPRSGRSRAYVNGRLATVTELADVGRAAVDLHGQHAHQSLLTAAAQRSALDDYGQVDLVPLVEARRRIASIDDDLVQLGGDSRSRAREIDLLRFQLDELEAAAVDDPDEDEALAREDDALAGAEAHREAGMAAHAALADDGGASDAVGAALAAVDGRGPFADIAARLRSVAAEVAEAAADARAVAEAIEDDPERLDAVRVRRRLLSELRRKYGESLAEVIAYADESRRRLADLEAHDVRVAELEAERTEAHRAERSAAAHVAVSRRAAAPALAGAIEAHLRELAMPKARVEIAVDGDDPADNVTFLLAANAGEPPLPLAKVASGGELARAMLAARLVLTAGPPTLVFDEVDAGVGGEAALAVGRALSALASDHQVLVVTHLPQVAAFADEQVAVVKREERGRTVAHAHRLDAGERVVELSRMLSGRPSSETARGHAEELLAVASRERGR